MEILNLSKEEMLQIYSDYHKEAFGVRPPYNYYTFTLEQLEADFKRFGRLCEENAQHEEVMLEQAYKAWNKLVEATLDLGAESYKTALRWIAQSHGITHDVGYLMWQHGLSKYDGERGINLFNDIEEALTV